MDHYHIWFNLKNTHRDLEFSHDADRFLGHLKAEGRIADHRLTRRKLGFGPAALGEFHLTISVRDLAQLDEAFGTVAPRAGPVEDFHKRVYAQVTDFQSALYRDFPDPVRKPRTEPA